MFLLKDKRSESWSYQISKIIESINVFYSICRPLDAKDEADPGLDTMYSERVSYKFLNPETRINLSNSIKMVDMLFALLQLTLNQKRSEPFFVYGHIKIKNLLDLIEGIVSHDSLKQSSSYVEYLGLNVQDFNVFLIHAKVRALETLSQMVASMDLIDHYSWLRACCNKLLESGDIMTSNTLLFQTLKTMNTIMRKYPGCCAKISIDLLFKNRYIIKPGMISHVMTMMKTLLLRKDTTVVKMSGQGKFKAGLLANEATKDLSPEYKGMSTTDLESRLMNYLEFLLC